MYKITVTVKGMACSMCESHINDTVRRDFTVKKVTSSRKKNCTEIISETPIDHEKLRAVFAATGYTIGDVTTEPYAKKSFWPFKHRNQ